MTDMQALQAARDRLTGGGTGNPRLDALARRKAELQAEIDAADAAHDRAMTDSYSYADAFGGNPAATAPSPPAGALPGPGPSPTPGPVQAAAGGSQIAPWARDLIRYTGETVANIPESAERVATGVWDAVTSPGETLDAAGRLLVGTGQTVNDAIGFPESMRLPGGDLGYGDQRATAAAAGQALADRYGGWEELGRTFRDDPVGFGLDVAGIAGVPAAAARLPGVAGRLPGPGGVPNRVTPRRAPLMSPEDVRVATDAGDAVREGVGRVRDAATEAGRRERGTRAFIENAPSTDDLRRAGGVFFEAAKNSGVRFSSRDFGPFRVKLLRTLRDEGADKVLHPKVARLVDRIASAPQGIAPSMADLMKLRRQFGAAAGDADADTRRLGSIGIDLLDEFVDKTSESAGGALREGNRLWSRMKKSERIDQAIALAETAQQGFEAGLRAEFKSIYRGIVKGDRKFRGFSPDETAAIKRVAEGDWTVNTLRRIASLGGGTGPQRAMLNLLQGSTVGGGLGFALGGPAGAAFGAAVGPVAGHVAGRMATRATQRRANLARAVAARGETPKQARKGPQDSTLAELMAGMMETAP